MARVGNFILANLEDCKNTLLRRGHFFVHTNPNWLVINRVNLTFEPTTDEKGSWFMLMDPTSLIECVKNILITLIFVRDLECNSKTKYYTHQKAQPTHLCILNCSLKL